jgi:hypothetical protein
VREFVDRDEDEPDRDEPDRDELDRDELDRDEEERELAERSEVECERVPRRVDSLELMVHPPQSSLSGRTHPTVIHSPQQHQRQLCQPWQQLPQQYLQEY